MTLGDMAKALNRSALYVRGLQERFDLPVLKGDAYPRAYLGCLRRIVLLRILGITEERLRELWRLEKKLLQLLHVDSTGAPTWFLDSCTLTTHRKRRLLLINFDLGFDISGHALQLGLDFSKQVSELFASAEMGEDAMRVLNKCLEIQTGIKDEIARELPLIRAAAGLAQSC